MTPGKLASASIRIFEHARPYGSGMIAGTEAQIDVQEGHVQRGVPAGYARVLHRRLQNVGERSRDMVGTRERGGVSRATGTVHPSIGNRYMRL